jgi:hypothetical protein
MGTFRGKFYLLRGGEDQQKIENGVEAPTRAVDATFHAISAVLAIAFVNSLGPHELFQATELDVSG